LPKVNALMIKQFGVIYTQRHKEYSIICFHIVQSALKD